MTVLREGKRKTLQARIEEPKQVKADGKSMNPHLAGAVLGEIPGDSPLYGKVEGVIILEVERGSAAANTGLRKHDIITSANRKNVASLDALRKAIGKNTSLLLNLRRGNSALFLYLQ